MPSPAHRITRVILCPYGQNRASRQACCGTSCRFTASSSEGNWDRLMRPRIDGMTCREHDRGTETTGSIID